MFSFDASPGPACATPCPHLPHSFGPPSQGRLAFAPWRQTPAEPCRRRSSATLHHAATLQALAAADQPGAAAADQPSVAAGGRCTRPAARQALLNHEQDPNTAAADLMDNHGAYGLRLPARRHLLVAAVGPVGAAVGPEACLPPSHSCLKWTRDSPKKSTLPAGPKVHRSWGSFTPAGHISVSWPGRMLPLPVLFPIPQRLPWPRCSRLTCCCLPGPDPVHLGPCGQRGLLWGVS